MRVPFQLILTVALLVATLTALSSVKTASGGQWNAANTWSPSGAPSNGDTLIIPDGVTVNVNCNCGSYSNMEINIFGTINFPGGRKINLSSNGVVNVFGGGLMTGSNNGDKLNIGGTTIWTGSQPDISGPSTCNSSGCATNPLLPVTLVSFSARETAEGVLVEWSTATETDCAYFTLSKSYDGVSWEGTVETECSLKSERLKHYQVSLGHEVKDVYFKLGQVDIDGRMEELGVVTVQPQNVMENEGFSLSPNPAQTFVSLNLEGNRYSIVTMIDCFGRLVYQRNVDSGPTIEIDVSGFEKGLYFILVSNANRQVGKKTLVVQH